jgi:hypothetical protein
MKDSGAKEIRTPDLFNAIEALYQLSYSPREDCKDTMIFGLCKELKHNLVE